ncbi:hypothetical protein V1264_021270 [Littorina saxatilis]|uniref:Potassium channel domain-containing protein n=2 Tax=Littorina saxatilis TaxID=31220 RepID=A0AAN9AI07_9CAEN
MLYAVIGIPMTLLCLTNIGSFMARCFRMLWKQIVCKPCRNHIRRRSMYRAAKQKAAAAAYVASLAKQKRGVANARGVAIGKAGTEGGRSYDEGASDSPAAVHDGTSLLGKGGGANNSPLPSGDSRYMLGFEGLTAGESVSRELHKKGPPSDSSDRTVIPLTESPRSSIPSSARHEQQHQQQPAREETEKVQVTDAENPEITITATNPCSDPDLVLENDDMQRALKHTISVSSQPEVVRVPIMVCLIMVAAYINLGAVLFLLWEDWSYFDSSYFCFITLSTIGFGDIVPGFEHDSWGNQAKRVSCTLYLLFGLALLAMCFELIQSECRQKFLTLARAMGLNGDGRS